MVFGEDFRLADISLVKDGSGFQGPTLDPAASVLPLSLPGHALGDAGPDTNLPVFRDVLLLLAAGSVKFDQDTGCVFVSLSCVFIFFLIFS